MKLAFWKRKRSRRSPSDAADAPAKESPVQAASDNDEVQSAAHTLRVRTRRRLVGACALLLAVVVLVPMLLDPAPRALPDSIPIDLPSDKTPFVPRAVAPPVEAPAAADTGAGIPAAPGSAADAAAVAADAPGAAAGAAKPAPDHAPAAATPEKRHAGEAAKPEAHHSAHKGEGASAAPAKIYVQAAALANESAAKDLANRLIKSGMSPFVERTDTGDGVRYRVRLGPFASRGDAERYRARLRSLGVHSNIVGA